MRVLLDRGSPAQPQRAAAADGKHAALLSLKLPTCPAQEIFELLERNADEGLCAAAVLVLHERSTRPVIVAEDELLARPLRDCCQVNAVAHVRVAILLKAGQDLARLQDLLEAFIVGQVVEELGFLAEPRLGIFERVLHQVLQLREARLARADVCTQVADEIAVASEEALVTRQLLVMLLVHLQPVLELPKPRLGASLVEHPLAVSRILVQHLLPRQFVLVFPEADHVLSLCAHFHCRTTRDAQTLSSRRRTQPTQPSWPTRRRDKHNSDCADGKHNNNSSNRPPE